MVQAVGLHEGHDERVVTQQSALLADRRSSCDQARRNGEDLDAELRYVLDRSPKVRQLLNGARLLLQVPHNSGSPPEKCGCFEGHQMMGNLTENMRRSEGKNLPVPGTRDQLIACRSEERVGSEVVHEGICVEEETFPGGEIGERHGRFSSSSTSARICSN